MRTNRIIQIIAPVLFVLLSFLSPGLATAQSNASLATIVKEEKIKLLHHIQDISVDSNIVYGLSHVIELRVDSIHRFIVSEASLPLLEKEKAVRSLVFLMQEIGEDVAEHKLEMYEIPGVLKSYEIILDALVRHKTYTKLVMAMPPRHCQLVASAFSQYNGYALMDDIAVYKRVATAPEFILQFLEHRPDFRFADSLLLIAAAYNPSKIISCLNRDNPVLKNRIRQSNNIYIQQIVALSDDKEASELLPLLTQLAEKGITPDSILKSRMDVTEYFQLLVNTEIASAHSGNGSSTFRKVLRDGIRQKALSFYVNFINQQHSARDAIRFAAVKNLRPEDLYYIITSCGDDLYTSSYLGLYKRLMAYFGNEQADSLFELVHHDNFRTFMRLAANYNTLADFLTNMSAEKSETLLKSFIAGIEKDPETGLEKAMDIADAFSGLGSAPEIVDLIDHELQDNLQRCQASQQYFGIRLYTILSQVFDLVRKKDDLSKLWGRLGNYEMLTRSSLQNKKGEIVQMVLFYGDEDGASSFNNFQKMFADSNKWETTRNPFWITIRSRSEDPIIIYANKPLDGEEELDLRAQDSLISFLNRQSIEPVVLVHRGHSYHLSKTLKRLQPSVKLAILGSCGGYNSAISIATINPDVQIIGSKKTGSKSINDPIIDQINETLLKKKDIVWPEIWAKLAARFKKDESTLNLFNEYIPPGKNVSLFVLKLFNYYTRPVDLAGTH
jgi:hypothetical protein